MSRLVRRVQVVLVILASITLGVVARPSGEQGSRTHVLADAVKQRIDMGFPIGWYDSLSGKDSLAGIASEGADFVMPYYSSAADIHPYLDAAHAAGVRVLFELPRDLVKNVDVTALGSLVTTLRSDPAIAGWYLADEPSINTQLGPLTQANASVLYDAVKAADPDHPVAMAFTAGEDASSYASAMDVTMFDDYPCHDSTPEFGGFAGWSSRLDAAAATASTQGGFFPVLQAYGGAFSNRLPTAAEERYMVYSSVLAGATGIFFWTHYRSDATWVSDVLEPITSELRKLRPALAAGRLGLVRADRSDVRANVFRDPTTRTTYLVVAHRGSGSVRARFALLGGLTHRRSIRSLGGSSAVTLRSGRFSLGLGSYAVRIYRIT